MATESTFEEDRSNVLDLLVDNQLETTSQMISKLKLKYTTNLTAEIESFFIEITQMIPELKKGKKILAYLRKRISQTKTSKGYDQMLLKMRLEVQRKQEDKLKRSVKFKEGIIRETSTVDRSSRVDVDL